jgi:hypothetical protein
MWSLCRRSRRSPYRAVPEKVRFQPEVENLETRLVPATFQQANGLLTIISSGHEFITITQTGPAAYDVSLGGGSIIANLKSPGGDRQFSGVTQIAVNTGPGHDEVDFFGPETGEMTRSLFGSSTVTSLLKSLSVSTATTGQGDNIVLDGLQASGNVSIGLGYGYGSFAAYGGTTIGGALQVSALGGGENQVTLAESNLGAVGLTLGGFGNTIDVGDVLRMKQFPSNGTNAAPSAQQPQGNITITSLGIVTAAAVEHVEVVRAVITQALVVRFVETGGVDAQNFFGLGDSMVGSLAFTGAGNEQVVVTSDLILGNAGFSLGGGANTLQIGTPLEAKLTSDLGNDIEGVTIDGNLAVSAAGLGGSNQINLDPEQIEGTTTVTVGQGLDNVTVSGTFVGLAKFSAPLGPQGGLDIIQFVGAVFENGVTLAGFYTLPVGIQAREPTPA